MTTPSPQGPQHLPPTTDNSLGINVTVACTGNGSNIPPRLANRPRRLHATSPDTLNFEDRVTNVTVECTGDMTFRPRPKPPADNRPPE